MWVMVMSKNEVLYFAVNCESTVEVGGDATATSGGSTSSTTSSTTTRKVSVTCY